MNPIGSVGWWANFALADGSVRFVQNTIDTTNYQWLCVRNDGQVLTLE